MTENNRQRLRVIENTDAVAKRREDSAVTPPKEYHTNPMYEKLLQFTNNQKRRFTVDDLLKW